MVDLKKRSAVLNEQTLNIEIDLISPTFLQRLKKQTKVVKVLRQPPLGVLEEIGSIVSKLDLKIGDPNEIIAMIFERMKIDAEAQIQILACLLDCKAYPSHSTKKLIRNNLRPGEAYEILNQLFEFADLKSFLNTTILLKGMGLLKSREIIAQQQKEEVKTSGEPLTEPAPVTDGL